MMNWYVYDFSQGLLEQILYISYNMVAICGLYLHYIIMLIG